MPGDFGNILALLTDPVARSYSLVANRSNLRSGRAMLCSVPKLSAALELTPLGTLVRDQRLVRAKDPPLRRHRPTAFPSMPIGHAPPLLLHAAIVWLECATSYWVV